MDTAHWHQSMEGIEGGVKLGQNGGGDHHHHQQKKAKPQEQLNCPRCNSTNTKFCYYNNYSLTQPRYFCKTCRRYWTEGGSLRNVPVGGGSRKNKKSISSSPTTAMTTTSSSSSILSKLNSSNNSNSNSHHDHDPVNPSSVLVVPNLSQFTFQNTKIMDEGGASQDLNLAFQYVHQHASKMELDHNHMNMNQQSGGMTSSTSALELLRSGMASRGLNNSFIPNLIPDSSSTTTTTTSTSAIFSSPGFSLDFHHHGLNGSSRYHNEMQESNHGDHYHNGKILFPFPEAKQQINPNISTSSDQATHQNSRGSDEGGANSNGYWSGLLGGSGSW